MNISKVFRIEYETDEFTYKFHISALTMEEALAFLHRNIKKKYKVNTIYEVCTLDAITKEALPNVLIEAEGKPMPKIPENKSEWKCPWCGEVFEKEMGLKIHIGKTHK